MTTCYTHLRDFLLLEFPPSISTTKADVFNESYLNWHTSQVPSERWSHYVINFLRVAQSFLEAKIMLSASRYSPHLWSWWFFTALTRVHHRSPPWDRWIQFTSSIPMSLITILILSFLVQFSPASWPFRRPRSKYFAQQHVLHRHQTVFFPWCKKNKFHANKKQNPLTKQICNISFRPFCLLHSCKFCFSDMPYLIPENSNFNPLYSDYLHSSGSNSATAAI